MQQAARKACLKRLAAVSADAAAAQRNTPAGLQLLLGARDAAGSQQHSSIHTQGLNVLTSHGRNEDHQAAMCKPSAAFSCASPISQAAPGTGESSNALYPTFPPHSHLRGAAAAPDAGAAAALPRLHQQHNSEHRQCRVPPAAAAAAPAAALQPMARRARQGRSYQDGPRLACDLSACRGAVGVRGARSAAAGRWGAA